MADAVSAYESTLVGDQLPGDYKWQGGVLAADGNIYGRKRNVCNQEKKPARRVAQPAAQPLSPPPLSPPRPMRGFASWLWRD